MKFLVKKGILEAAVEKASGMVSKDDVRPILKNFLLQLSPEELKIMATDEELAAVASVRVLTVKEPGSITIPANKFKEIVAEAPDVEGEIETDNNVCVVKFGKSRWRLQGMAADQYPAIENFEGNGILNVDREKVLTVFKKVGFAVGKDVSRPGLMGVYFNNEEVYTTDGHRIQVMGFTHGVQDLLIPAPAIEQLIKVLDLSASKHLEIQKKERFILFKIGSDIYVTRILEAQYPDVRKIVGKTPEAPRTLKVVKEDLVNAIRRTRITASEESKALKFQVKKDLLTVSSLDEKGNTAEEELKCVWSGKEDLTKGVNFEYLTELLNALDNKDVVFLFGEDKEKKQAPFRVEEAGLTGVILPVRLTF